MPIDPMTPDDLTESDRAFAKWFAATISVLPNWNRGHEKEAWSAAVEWATRRAAESVRENAKTWPRLGDVRPVLLDVADRLSAGPTQQPAKE